MGSPPPRPEAQPPDPKVVTETGDTHPTGKHSCFHDVCGFYELSVRLLLRDKLSSNTSGNTSVITGLTTESLRNLAITMETKSVLHQLISVTTATKSAVNDLRAIFPVDLSVRGIFICRLIAQIIDQNKVYRSEVIFGSFASKCRRIYG